MIFGGGSGVSLSCLRRWAPVPACSFHFGIAGHRSGISVGGSCRHGKLRFFLWKVYLCHKLSWIFPSPFPLPTKQPGTQAGAGEKLPESLVFPPQHPSFPPAQLPALPSHSLQQFGGRHRCCGKLRAGAGGIRHPQTAKTLLQGMFGVDSSIQPSPSPTLPSAPRAVRLCWGKAAVQIGRHWSKDAALRSIGVIYVIVKAGRRGGRKK